MLSYIELINRFWERDREYHFSDRETALYFYLLSVCNSLVWKNPFGQSNAVIIAKFGWGRTSFDTARRKLKKAGLINYTIGDGRGNLYRYEIMMKQLTDAKKGTQKDTLYQHLSIQTDSTFPDSIPAPSIDIEPEKEKKNKPKQANKKKCELTPAESEYILRQYHTICRSYPQIEKLNARTEQKIMMAVKQMGGMEKLNTLFENMEQSDFMRGQNQSGWRASLEWAVENSNNWHKILAGKYANKTPRNQSHPATNYVTSKLYSDDRW